VFAYFSWDALPGNGELITRVARIQIPYLGDERETAMGGVGGAQRHVLRVHEPKKVGARNGRAHRWAKTN